LKASVIAAVTASVSSGVARRSGPSLKAGFRRAQLFGMVCLMAASGWLASGMAQAQLAEPGPRSLADVAEPLMDAVVNISTSQNVRSPQIRTLPGPGQDGAERPEDSPFEDLFRDFLDQNRGGEQPRRVNSLGSGFVIDPAGIIVTNNHVIADADEITVNLNDGTELEAEVVGRDTKTDIAVLRVQPETPLTAVPFAQAEDIRIGDWVLAIGNPFGLGGSVTTGIVSAVKRVIDTSSLNNFIQTDAAINRGNSGGPLFNMDGEVVGINTAIISSSGGSIGIGFAIPANLAIPVIRQLVDFGETRRGWLGVRAMTVSDEIAESLGLEEPKGALVANVSEGSPAADAGLQEGDVITQFGDKIIEEARDLLRAVTDTPVGSTVEVDVIGEDGPRSIEIDIAQLDETENQLEREVQEEQSADEGAALDFEAFGMRMTTLTPEIRDEEGIDESVEGLLVLEVDPDSEAAARQIEVGNIITSVGQEYVATPADFLEQIDIQKQKGRNTVLLLVTDAGGDNRFIVLPLPQ
jgi:serine protease Do